MSQKRIVNLPQAEGVYSRQAHADIPEGTYEREIGRDGFFGPATHMYHANYPMSFTSVSGGLAPRAFNPTRIPLNAACPWDALSLFYSSACRVRFWRTQGAMRHLVRNADGDDLLFIQNGGGEFYCDYGHLRVEEGDYVLIPRGTLWRIEATGHVDILMVESTGAPYTLPDVGAAGQHVPFDPGVLDRPQINDQFRAQQQDIAPWEVRVKRCNEIGTITYPFNPLDAVGWKGDLYPVRLNVRDIRPLMSHRLHLPPSALTTFLGNRFVVLTGVPRPLETDPGAMKLPFFHSNDDYEEIVFVHRGNIGSRGALLGEGGMTYHPMGFAHGPHPQVMPYMFQAKSTTTAGYILAIDVLDPLTVGEIPEGGEIPNYSDTWSAPLEVSETAVKD